MALSGTTLDWDGYDFRNLIRVAAGSALLNTSLRPHLIYDGPASDFTKQIQQMGVTVIHHRTSLYDAIVESEKPNENFLHVAAATFLRFEIPLLEFDDEFALYTDCDVLFLKDPWFGKEIPLVFGASSETSRDPTKEMNSGVMLMNLPNWRKLLPTLHDFTRQILRAKFCLDQDVLRLFFGRNYMSLDTSLNWKPYWGWNPDAQIVHYHGPKPSVALEYLKRGKSLTNDIWENLLERNPVSYAAYTRLWYLYCDTLVPQFGTLPDKSIAPWD